MNKNKPKIALIVDQENWCFANICRNFTPYLKDKYDFTIIPTAYLSEGIINVLLMTKEYDLVHFFWRGMLADFSLNDTRLRVFELGSTYDNFIKNYVTNRAFTVSIYDHLYSEEKDKEFNESYLKYIKGYTVSSNLLFDIYNNLNLSKKPNMIVTDGVDLEKFTPKNLERFKTTKSRNIVVGWVGNSAWANKEEDFKGVNTILKPAIEELIEEGYPLEMDFADRQIKMTPFEEMPNYYSKIDLYICTSKMEGTPNPVLESMACGIPIITTNVGIVSEAFGEKQKKYILKERSKECLKDTIKEFLNDLDNIDEISKENIKQIKNWTWDRKAKDFDKFFEEILKTKE